MKTLEYHGKPMKPEPINMSLVDVVLHLRDEEPVIVQLEPGDATHYCLLIVPAWADGVKTGLGRFGIPEHSAHSYLIVTKLDDRGGTGFYAFADGTEEADMLHIENEWTKQVFAWWFNLLWEKLRA